MKAEELEAMSNGLRIALKYAKDKRRFTVLEGMYAESLVAKKLLKNKRNVDFHAPQFDCGGASFGKGRQIKEDQFDYCVFVLINKDNFEPEKFFVFSLEDLEECAKPRPRMTTPDTPSILFYYKDFKEFVKESQRTGEPIFNIEKKLHSHLEWFEDRWNKIQ